MASKSLTGNDLRKIGYPQEKVIGIALKAFGNKELNKMGKEAKLQLLQAVLATPEQYVNHPILSPIALELTRKAQVPKVLELTERKPYQIFGQQHIEPAAMHQMDTAMKLPVAVAGALMPDAHVGYGLPIGGVLAVRDAVIPYAVGVDIGCRMCLSIFPEGAFDLERERQPLKKILSDCTRFGHEAFDRPLDDSIFQRPEFRELTPAKRLLGRAEEQIGSSGGGNHFVEFGRVSVLAEGAGVPIGSYVGLLSHSGSRGLGAMLAGHYTRLAAEMCRLPREAAHLAWLDMNHESGQEYWRAMTLAGDYASANHDHIHRRIAKALGIKPLIRIENHHNFAWKEQLADGSQAIVHRKGATPAGEGVLGIIPGSMVLPGYIVRGRGLPGSLASASHGAGRRFSRQTAKNQITQRDMKNILSEYGVELIGSGLDEAPQAYKDIREVMAAQNELVDILGSFTPKIVRMAGEVKGRMLGE